MDGDEALAYLEVIDSQISRLRDIQDRLAHAGAPPSPEPTPSTSPRTRSATPEPTPSTSSMTMSVTPTSTMTVSVTPTYDSDDARSALAQQQSSFASRIQGLEMPPVDPFIVRREMHPLHPALPPTLRGVMVKVTSYDWETDLHYPRLSLDDLLAICKTAHAYAASTSGIPSWNMAVHNPVIEMALGVYSVDMLPEVSLPPSGPGPWPLPCTLLTINAGLGQAEMSSYGVKFLSQSHDQHGLLGAELHIGLTQTAHWDKLTKEAEAQVQAQAQALAQAQPWSQPPSAQGSPVRPPPRLPEFLPGIIAQGHEWRFVVTTREFEADGSKKTVVWVTRCIGRTDSVPGILQIVHCLRHISTWCREVFWPWYRDNTRGVGEAAFSSDSDLDDYCRALAAAVSEWPTGPLM
ncbi:hypothetical protein VM1G_08141 [Cytospora mali]|uniref:PD-(D/E)XK nuclease-like domain-containing protein n=1 Tax=Cytospora mali TaxID=578113 RepID=A0A194W8W3_CYTMA|nr:hypothetical protein VM1G_08141 [Valsa mali]